MPLHRGIVPLALCVLAAASPARAQGVKAPAAVGEVDRLRAAGKLREAGAKARDALAALGDGGDPAQRERLLVAEDAVRVAAAAAYARGEDCGLYTAEERAAAPLSGEPLDALSRRLTTTTLERLAKLEFSESRDLYLKDAAFAPLRTVSAARYLFVAVWKRRHLEVWPFPTLRVDTSDPQFDATFDYAAHQAMLRPSEPSVAREWLRQPVPPQMAAAAIQAWQRALLAPADFPLPRLASQEGNATVLGALEQVTGPGPWGFDAMVLLPFAIETGDVARARRLVDRLGPRGGYISDLGLNCALRLLQKLDLADPELSALYDHIRAHAFGTPPAPAEEGEQAAGIEEQRRLVREGKLAEARARGKLNTELGGGRQDHLTIRRQLADLATLAAAGHAYARGEDARWFTDEELAREQLSDKPLRARGVRLLFNVAGALSQGIPVMEMRHAILDDPDFAQLRDGPLLRLDMYEWGQPASVVWPKLEVKTGDPTFDRLFRESAMLSPQPGIKVGAIGGWMEAEERRQTGPADAWLLRWRCALLLPYGEGGWPYRIGLLQDPAAVAAVLKTLEERVKKPKGFDAMARVNLHLATGDFAAATALIAALQKEGGIFYDMAVAKALALASNTLRADPGRRGLAAFHELLVQHAVGLPPKKR